MKTIFILAVIIASVAGHGWMVTPPSRDPDTTNSNAPCDALTANSPAPLNTPAGSNIDVTWITPHSGGPTDIHINLVPTSSLSDSSAYVSLGNFAYSAGSASVTIPASTTAGSYVLQWHQDSPGPYYNCADLQILAAVPPGATVISGSTYQVDHGTFDAATGVLTCDSGYKANSAGNDCVKSGLSGGAAFGVFLLVVVLVAIVAFVGIVIFLKVKRPEKYDEYKLKIVEKVSRIRS
jgi:hypothetical protein